VVPTRENHNLAVQKVICKKMPDKMTNKKSLSMDHDHSDDEEFESSESDDESTIDKIEYFANKHRYFNSRKRFLSELQFSL
jgi:hypothetical protein